MAKTIAGTLVNIAKNVFKKDQQLEAYADKSFEAYLSDAKASEITSYTKTIGDSRLYGIAELDNLKKITFPNVAYIGPDCGRVHCTTTNSRFTVVFEQPVTIDIDAFEESSNVDYEFRGGIKSIHPNCFWNSQNVTVKIKGDIPKGQPWVEDPDDVKNFKVESL